MASWTSIAAAAAPGIWSYQWPLRLHLPLAVSAGGARAALQVVQEVDDGPDR